MRRMNDMEAIRATETWQHAGVYYVRTEAMVNGFDIPLKGEFDADTPESKYILVLDGVHPVGTCRIHFIPEEGYAKIERVAVVESYRGRGVGRIAITAAEDWIREEGFRKIVITSRDEAVGFYQALGYTADFEKTETGGVFTTVYTEKNLK